MMSLCRVLVMAIVIVGFANLARAQRCVEVSADGRDTAVLTNCGNSEGGVAGAGSSVPFALQPDWSNSQRRQVASLRVADLNGDTLVDLVVGCFNSNSFPPYDDWHNFIHYNTGSALEALPTWVSTDQVHTNDVQVADINGDTFPDVFSANGGSSHSPSVIYFGTATGPSTAPGWGSVVSPSTWATSAALLDFDHDGDVDVITTNQSAIAGNNFRPIYIYRSQAGMLPQTPVALSAELSIQSACALADFDNNGWEDLGVSKWTNGFQSCAYRNMNGNFEVPPNFTTGVSDTDKGVAWADVDDNGWVDLAIGAGDGTQLWSNTNGVLTLTWTALAPFPGQQDLAFADVDGDGDDDLAEIHFSTGRTHIYLNISGALDPNPSWTYDAPNVGNALAFGDINNDGRVDLACGYSAEPSIRIFYGLPPCPANIVNTGSSAARVDVDDLLSVISHWGPCPAPPAMCIGNIVGAGATGVNVDDLLAVISGWGTCPE